MENPKTWNIPTMIIAEAWGKAEQDRRARIVGLSVVRQIHDALEAEGWLRTPEEREGRLKQE